MLIQKKIFFPILLLSLTIGFSSSAMGPLKTRYNSQGQPVSFLAKDRNWYPANSQQKGQCFILSHGQQWELQADGQYLPVKFDTLSTSQRQKKRRNQTREEISEEKEKLFTLNRETMDDLERTQSITLHNVARILVRNDYFKGLINSKTGMATGKLRNDDNDFILAEISAKGMIKPLYKKTLTEIAYLEILHL